MKRALLVLLVTLTASANELIVDRTTLNTDDTLTITVALDGAFTSVEPASIPLQNLKIIGSPSMSSQISWVNGTLTQRKVYQYQARPLAAGPALVGPLIVESSDGHRDTLAPVAVQVLPDLAAGSNDPQQVLRELLATRRDPIFIIAQADRTSAYVGEEIVVTWTLYNGTSVEQWELANVPRREDFWSEQLDIHGERPETVMFGQVPLQKMVILRLALFPLHSGPLTISPLEIHAEVMHRSDDRSPFGMFEGSVFDVTRHNAPLTIDVKPVPPGPPVDIVGDLALNCAKPRQANGGPVVIDVSLAGRANVRTAPPPHWAGALDGSTQVEAGAVNVIRGADEVTMTRQWKLLVFPSRAGRFTLPPLATRAFSPGAGRQELRCNAVTLDVTAAADDDRHPERSRGARPGGGAPSFRPGPSTTLGVTIVLIAIVALILIAPRIRRASALRRRAREIARPPEQLRDKLHALLAARKLDETSLLREQTERGDAYRSLLSGLESDNSREEVEFRLRELLQFLK